MCVYNYCNTIYGVVNYCHQRLIIVITYYTKLVEFIMLCCLENCGTEKIFLLQDAAAIKKTTTGSLMCLLVSTHNTCNRSRADVSAEEDAAEDAAMCSACDTVEEVGSSVFSLPSGSSSFDGSGGPKHIMSSSRSGKSLQSRNVGQPTPAFSSMTFSQPPRTSSQRSRQGFSVVLPPCSPAPQNGK